MFAQLTYPVGSTIASVVADISDLLTGAQISALSAALDKGNSALNESAGAGGPATWEFQSNSGSFADAFTGYTNQSVTVHGARVLRQLASTSFGTQYKFLKIGLVSPGGSPTSISFAMLLGKGQTSGNLTGTSKMYGVTASSIVGSRLTSSATVFQTSIYVQVYSSPSATLINIAPSDRFSFVPCLALLDFAPVSPKLNIAGNLCTIISTAGVALNRNPSSSDYNAFISEVSVNGRTWSSPVVNGNISGVSIGTPMIENVLQFNLREQYKFAGFSSLGSKFDLQNVGVTRFLCQYYDSVAGQIWYTNDLLLEQIPYSSITDISGVYGCNRFAFGDNGSIFQTPVGDMCKFGYFMVKVV